MTRWLLVPLSAVAVWYGAFITGIGAVAVLDAFCPAEQLVSGLCTAPWHAPAVNVLIIGLAALAAFGIVVVPARVAPSHGFIVAVSMFGLGAAFATWIALGGGMPGPFAAAAVGGGTALLVVQRRRW